MESAFPGEGYFYKRQTLCQNLASLMKYFDILRILISFLAGDIKPNKYSHHYSQQSVSSRGKRHSERLVKIAKGYRVYLRLLRQPVYYRRDMRRQIAKKGMAIPRALPVP